MPRIRVHGVELFYELTGDAGEPMVLVHGSWGDHHNWDAVVPALSRTFRVLTYDRRGHSESERPPGQGSIRDDVADLAALIETLGLAPAHIVGNSGGATVVLRLAAERAELVRSLIVHEPALVRMLANDPANAAMAAAAGERLAGVIACLNEGDMERAAHRFVEEVAFGPGAWANLPEPVRQTFVRNAPTFLDEMRDPDDASADLEALHTFARPALLTQGDQSPPMFPRVVDMVARAMPRAVRRTFEGSGHVPHRTHPQAYVEVVTRFASGASTK